MFKLINNILIKIGKKNAIIGKSYYKIKPHYSEILKKSNSKIKYNEQHETKDI